MQELVITYWDDIKGCKGRYSTVTSRPTTAIFRFKKVFDYEILDAQLRRVK